MKLLQRLDGHARAAGARVAYREVGEPAREMTYAQLWERSLAFAAALRARVAGGGVVMLCAPNRVEYPVAFLGILAAGFSVFPMSPETVEAELVSLGRESRAVAIVGTERACGVLGEALVAISLAEVMAGEAVAGQPRDGGMNPAVRDLLLCSSGTTGRPKIVLRDAGSLDAASANMVKGVGFTDADRVLAVVPLCHSYGLEHGLLAPIWAGSTVHLCSGFDLGVVTDQLERHGISLFPSVPSVYDMMCHAGEVRKFPALRKAYAAGAPLPQTVADQFQAKFGVPVSQLFGMTEIGSVTFADPADPHYDPRSVGRPFEGVRIRIVDPQTRAELSPGESGEVLMHAPSMFRGYLNEPASGVVEGYFPTGDLGRVDAHGNLTITGRLKLLIEVGGQKVNVLEVEDALRQHPMVGDAVVVAMRVSETVSRLKAVVTPKTPGQSPVAEELRQFLRGRLTGYKVPRLIEVVASLPRSPAGKVLRSVLENA